MEITQKRLNSVGTKIKQIRESQGMSCAELARRAGMTKQAIYKHERDLTHNIPYKTIKVLSDALNVNPSYLVGWSTSIERTPDIINEGETEITSNII